MAGSLKTAFFNLVKYAANDITSWLTDFNGNMDKIDAAMNQNKTAAQTAQDGVNNLEAEYETVTQTLAQHTTAIDNNEKAIASNTASISKLGNEVNSIIIGEYAKIDNDTTGLSKIESLASNIRLFVRRVGNGIDVKGDITINQGTTHAFNRTVTNGVLEGLNVIDIYRITGNIFNLPTNVYFPLTPLSFKPVSSGATSTNVLTYTVVYLQESGYTVIGWCTSSSTGIAIESEYQTLSFQ